jgi:hypothetical protein
MDEKTATGLEFPINQKLLDEAIQTKEEWRILKDRLAKIEENKEQVSASVYERVRADYRGRLKGTTEAVLAKKAEVDQELAGLREARNRIVAELDQHRQRLEEIKFRNMLGEFAEEEYQSQARGEQELISKFEAVLAAVNGNVHRYESLYENEPELFSPVQAAPEPEEEPSVSGVSGISTTAHDAEPLTDAAGYVIEEEGDYFGGEARGDAGRVGFLEANTDISISAGGGERTARVIIINGDEAGTTYPVKGTISFGRAESNTIPIRDAKVSRQHAQIQQQGVDFVIVDLNSSNGTFVNGGRIEEHVLSNGDEIRIGDCILQFQA